MAPPAIVDRACARGLGLIAVCDHNAAGNAEAVQRAAGGRLVVLAGLELATAEDIHVLGLFPDVGRAVAAADAVGVSLPDGSRRPVGGQWLLDAEGRVLGQETRMLAAASSLGLADAIALVKGHGGLAIAAHVDRPSFSVVSQLGCWPPGMAFDAVEISAAGVLARRDQEWAALGVAMVTGSDSHYLADIGCCWTELRMDRPGLEGVAGALACGAWRIRHA